MLISRTHGFNLGNRNKRRVLACAFALAGLTTAARADGLDLDSMKDMTIPSVSVAGVTIYGTVDVGYAYSTHSVPASGAFYVGADSTIYGSRYANQAISTITNNSLEQSKIGVKIEESIGGGWVAIGKLETGFNPISGEISDACASLLRNNGKLYSQMDTNGDGSRCGQAFNGPAYGGVSNSSYGTLTVGRQQSLMLDGLATYDPMQGAYAFSLIGYSGTPAGGIGSTETARWDNSVKYVYQYGPVHAAAMYTNGGQDTPMMGDGYGANVGATWQGFSIDGFYTKEHGAVNLSSIPALAYSSSGCGLNTSVTPNTYVNCPDALNGTITDNESWSVMAKYTFNVGGGGLKDEGPADKVTIFGAYVYIDLSNPDHYQNYYNGFNTIGGYQFLTTTKLGVNAFGSDKLENTEWAGVRYEMGWGLNITGAYYHWGQNSYLNASNVTCAANNAAYANGTSSVNNGVGKQIASNCAGDFNQGSLLLDYVFNKHFDVYAGVSYTEIGGGLASGFLQDNNTTFASGLRVKF